jgi:hypothetical protein
MSIKKDWVQHPVLFDQEPSTAVNTKLRPVSRKRQPCWRFYVQLGTLPDTRTVALQVSCLLGIVGRVNWMAVQQVFIIWSHPLFHESVRLLLKHPDVEIIGSTANYETARDDIERLRPDTVIVEETSSGTHEEALAILDSSRFVPRVIGFSLDDNKLNVYRRQESTIVRAEDLLSTVRGDQS